MSDYRQLNKIEVAILEGNGCRADSWEKIQVTDSFDAHRVFNSVFQGDIRIGRLANSLAGKDGISRMSEISNARLDNVKVGDDCHISGISGWLSNLDIGKNVIIENSGSILCHGESSFGNGCDVETLNEGGGRSIRITSRTSAQVAYLAVLYRDRDTLVGQLDEMAVKESEGCKSNRAEIMDGAVIMNTGKIVNVYIGKSAVIDGVLSLENGTVDSAVDAPTYLGRGITAENFIIQKGASTDEGAMLSSTLIGEGTKIGKQFSSENSLFFANCEGFHSEACSVFAGPYTVTHHRSTLLIAGMFSFFNAGSATNQSNHMYKLGPLHQGILERGCKTGSGSYLLWPARVGAFTAIMGKHYANFDTSDFPFSYIDIVNGKSTLIPGMNIFTVGTVRDGFKWPSRDRRKNADKLDLIIFDVLSPYTAQKMIRGIRIMTELYEKTVKGQDSVIYNGIHIKRLLLKTCRRYYQMALDIYLGEILLKRLETGEAINLDLSDAETEAVNDEWIDVNGLLCKKSRLEKLIGDIEGGKISDYSQLQGAFEEIYNSYSGDEWDWFKEYYRKSSHDLLSDDLKSILEKWQIAYRKYYNLVVNDAKKEFEGNVRIGFGIDGNREEDFDAVRGKMEDNKFILQINDLGADLERRFESAIGKIDSL